MRKVLVSVLLLTLVSSLAYGINTYRTMGNEKLLNRKIQEVENRRKQLEREYQSGRITPDTYYQVSEQMEQNIIALEGQRHQARQEDSPPSSETHITIDRQ